MCDMVLIGLSENTDTRNLRSIEKAHGRRFASTYIDVKCRSTRKYRWYVTSKGFCECGTVIGCMNDTRWSEFGSDIDREVRKWKRKGWSDAKIARATYSMENDTRHKASIRVREMAEFKEQSLPLAESWLAFIRGCYEKLNGDSFYLMLHFGCEGNRVRALGEKSVAMCTARAEDLMYLKYDVLYRIT